MLILRGTGANRKKKNEGAEPKTRHTPTIERQDAGICLLCRQNKRSVGKSWCDECDEATFAQIGFPVKSAVPTPTDVTPQAVTVPLERPKVDCPNCPGVLKAADAPCWWCHK